MQEKKKIWAAVCGDVRYEFEVYAIIFKLVNMRSQGLIEGIVLSTWENSIKNIDGLEDLIYETNITLVEVPKLHESIGNYAHMGYMRQAIQLKHALDAIPDDVFVLKCRTDFSTSDVRILEDSLELQVPVLNNSFNTYIKYHIVVNELSLSLPFMFKDIAFYGYKLDIEKTVCFDLTVLSTGQKFMADFSFFLFPFLNNNLFLKDFYMKINYSDLKIIIERLDLESFNTMPEILIDFFSLYFCIIDSCFICNPHFIFKPVDIDHMFVGDTESACVLRWHKAILSSNIINYYVKGSTAIQTKFLVKIRNRISNIDNLSSKRLTDNGIDEFACWAKSFFGLIIPNRNQGGAHLNTEPTPVLEFVEAIIQKYPDSCEKEIIDIFETITDSTSFHKALVIISEKKLSKSFSQMILETMPRYIGWSDQLLLYVSRKMTEDEIDDKTLKILDSFIRKYSNSGKHLFVKMNPVKIAANYNLAIYYKKRDDEFFANKFIESVSKELLFISKDLPIELFVEELCAVTNNKISTGAVKDVCRDILKLIRNL